MFNMFKKKNQPVIVEEQPVLSNQIELTTEELNEIDEIIKNLTLTYDEVKQDIATITSETPNYKIEDPLEDIASEEAKEKLDFIKGKLNSVMDEFMSFQIKKMNEKLKSIEDKLNVWKNLRLKIDGNLKLSIGEIDVNSNALPISIFLNKISKTINDNPNLLSEDQTKKLKSSISSVMEEAFKS